MVKKYIFKIKKFFQFGNRTFNDYAQFLETAKANGCTFSPLKDFIKPRIDGEKLIGLRHDVDSELDHALKIAKIEHDLEVKATYYVLHTAKYFYKDIEANLLQKGLIEKLLYLQNTLGHEIGLHIDLMPIEVVYKKDPLVYTQNLVSFLRSKGLNIVGVAPHGNLFKDIYRKKHSIEGKEFINGVFADPYRIFQPSQVNVSYEAYNLPHDRYYSDAMFINNARWDFTKIKENFFNESGRTIILTHTIHWAPSVLYYFTINFSITVKYFLTYLKEYLKYKKSK